MIALLLRRTPPILPAPPFLNAMPKTSKHSLTLIERVETAYSILHEALVKTTDPEVKLKALHVMAEVMEIEGRLTGAFQTDRDNECIDARKRDKRALEIVEIVAAAAAAHGL